MPRRLARNALKLPLALTLCCAALSALPALASADLTIVVNTTTDQAPSMNECQGAPGDCSLRQAVDLANDTPGNDTIVLGAFRYELTIPGEDDEGLNGDLDVLTDQLRITGAGARKTAIAASPTLGDRLLEAFPGTALGLTGLTVTGGDTESGGGGGGIRSDEAPLTLVGVAVTDNVARLNTSGGGVSVEDTSLTIFDSTIARNRNSGDGGGLYLNSAKVLIENSTIADNRVDTSLFPGNPGWGAYGGAMETEGGQLVMKNVTVTGNSITDTNGGPPEGEGAAIYGSLASSEVVNTIIYGNTATNVEKPGQCESTLTAVGPNVEAPPGAETPCFSGTPITANPLLGPLANNGGETDTAALKAGSSAIDTGLSASCAASDQRGVARPAGACDIGAFEFVPEPPSPTPAAKPTIARKGKVVVKAAGKRFKVWPGVRVSCPAGGPRCTGTLIATAKLGGASSSAAKAVRVGKVRFSVAPGKAMALTVKLSRKASLALDEAGRLRVGFTVSSQAADSGLAKKSFKLTLKPPKPRVK